MKRLFFFGLLSLGLFASCQKEASVESNQVDPTAEIVATLGDVVETRTQAQAETNPDGSVSVYKTVWSEKDAFRFFQVGSSDLKCVLSSGAGTTKANFTFAGGNVGGVGIEVEEGVEADPDYFVGVYPFTEAARVAYVGGNYEVSTEVPATQYYSENSFGYDAAPMVAVGDKINKLSFRNMASILVVQMTGDVAIASATLSSKTSNIAGKVTATAHADNNWIPTLDLSNGSNKVTILCEEAVQLNTETATKFFFILAPGTYKANDLVLKFSDVAGFYNEFEIPIDLEVLRSTSTTLPVKAFEANGSDAIPLRVRVKTTANLTADRIVPSLKTLADSFDWIKALAAHPNIEALLSEVASYISMKEYELAYNALNGVPGFTLETVSFEATKTATAIVDYDGGNTFESIINGIDTIDSIESLINYLEEAEEKYDAIYDFSGKFNTAVGNISDMVEEYFDLYLNNSPKEIEDMIKLAIKESSKVGSWVYAVIKDWSLADILKYDAAKKIIDPIIAKVKANIMARLAEVETVGMTDILKSLTSDSESITTKMLNYMFEQEASLTYVKGILKDIISGIEELEIDRIAAENMDWKKYCIGKAVENAVGISNPAAKAAVVAALEQTNQAQLDKLSSGPWGLFQLLTNSADVADFCAKNNLMEVYDALVNLDKAVQNMVVYNQNGVPTVTPALPSDYVENVDYWVEALTASENN